MTFLRACSLSALVALVLVLPFSTPGLHWSSSPLLPWLSGTAFAAGLAASLVERKPVPRLKWLVLAWSVAVAAYGWLAAWFPLAVVDRESGSILPLNTGGFFGMGTVDQQSSVAYMTNVTVALLALMAAFDVATRRGVRLGLGTVLSVGGTMVALAGLWTHAAGDMLNLWAGAKLTPTVFGFFWYHGNAAAYLNVTWPVSMWVALCVLRKPKSQLAKAGVLFFVLVQLVAVFVNISKAGHALAIVEALAFIPCARRLADRDTSGSPWRAWHLALMFAALVGLVALAAGASGSADGWQRWQHLAARGWVDGGRRQATTTAIRAAGDGGWTGFGPGTFEWVFAHYTQHDPVIGENRWRHAHDDYAEVLVEWGGMGFGLIFAGIATGGVLLLVTLVKDLRSDRATASFERGAGLWAGMIALAGIGLHAMMDFPFQIPAILIQAAIISGFVLGLVSDKSRRFLRPEFLHGPGHEARPVFPRPGPGA